MKKLRGVSSILLILVFLLLVLAGCGQGQDEDTTPDGESQGNVENGDGTDSAVSAGFAYSKGIDENGFWEGVRALDYVTLFDYKAMSIPSSVHTVTDETVQGEVQGIMGNFSTDQQVLDRAVVDGDTVNIDYVGSVDGVEFDGGSTGGFGTDVTIGVTSYIDDFLEQLIGHTPGETINVEVTFPDNYGVDELNGKDAVFVTTINYIVESVAPELDDAFVAGNLMPGTGWTTVDEMNRGIAADLQNSEIIGYVQDYLANQVEISELPDGLLSYMEESMVNYYQSGADYYGVGIEEILGMYEGLTTVEELLAVYHDSNVRQANYYLVVQAIAEDAQMTVGDEELAAYFDEYMNGEDYQQYEAEFGMPYLKQVVLHQMVMDYLVDNAVLE